MLVSLLTIILTKGRCDSPLTSTPFAMAYNDIPLIKAELEDGENYLSEIECAFLFDTANSLDKKIAFINALGNGDTTHTEKYIRYLMSNYTLKHSVFDSILVWRGGQPAAYNPAAKLTYQDYAVLSYLQIMGNYFAPLKGYYCAYRAADLNSNSEAATYVFGLVMSQFYLDRDWCTVYEVMFSVKAYDEYTTDRMRVKAIETIFEYIDTYKDACNGGPNPPRDYFNKAENTSLVKKEEPLYNKPDHPQKMESKKNYVDLEVISIAAPEYDESLQGSIIKVKIKNKGTISNIETNAILRDLDITVAEAKKMKLSKLEIEAIKENNNRANDEGEWVTKGVDYDFNWTLVKKIPILQPGEEIEIVFRLENYWIFDSNCEIELLLDFDKNIEEKNEENNKKVFIAWG